jgi:hypothetical protein
MDYKLAKQLKDAGFPFRSYFGAMKENAVIVGHNLISFMEGDIYFVPTLSELIEACGGDFRGLTRFDKDHPFFKERGEWHAWSDIERGFQRISETQVCEDYIRGYGETPEEAVAHLWLALLAPNTKNE